MKRAIRLDPESVFVGVRSLFGGSVPRTVVEPVGDIIDMLGSSNREGLVSEKEYREWGDDAIAASLPARVAYVMATIHHETARTWLPIAEYGRGQGRPYGQACPLTGRRTATYYGRGYVQLTWLENYHRMAVKLGVNLVSEPDRAMQPETAWDIIALGMTMGMFTGKALGHYFNRGGADPVGARRIVNGTDRAEQIASYYETLLPRIKEAM